MREIVDLSPAELERLVKRLVHHAWCNMRYLTYRGAPVARSGFFSPGEFVDIAIGKALEGKRKWNKTKYVTLFGFLRSVVDSEMNHAIQSPDNELGRHFSYDDSNDDQPMEYDRPTTEPEPPTAVIDREWGERQVAFHDAAIKLLDGEQSLVDLLECMETDITEPAEIAIALGVTVEHVNNEKKRLKRKLEKIDPRTDRAKKGKAR